MGFLLSFHSIGQVGGSKPHSDFSVEEISNQIFTSDLNWRGADGAASIDLKNGKVLWLFSDTFIDTQARQQRKHAPMIRNSIAIQQGLSFDPTKMSYYHQGKSSPPKSFFSIPAADTWFWTGHGALIDGQLVIFLIEEKSTSEGLGFAAVGWYVALIANPNDPPLDWDITYIKGTDTGPLIVGSSAVFVDGEYVYAYAVSEPKTHEVYLARLSVKNIIHADVSKIEWWNNQTWGQSLAQNTAPLFIGQTEFSVHFDPTLNQYIQIQTYGFGMASLGYRKANNPQGPWSQPIMFYHPKIKGHNLMIYSANAHPEFNTEDGILVTYNINNNDFDQLLLDQSIYFPRMIKLKILK